LFEKTTYQTTSIRRRIETNRNMMHFSITQDLSNNIHKKKD